jgi:hypothetical protein
MLSLQPKRAEKPKGPLFDFKGKSLMQMLEQIENAGLDEVHLQKLFGRAQAMEAYRVIMTNRGRYRQAEGSIETAVKEDAGGQMVKLPETVPSIAAAQAARIRASKLAGSAEPLSVGANLAQASADYLDTHQRELGGGHATEAYIALQGLGRAMRGIIPGANDAAMRDNLIRSDYDQDPQLRKQIREHLGLSNTDVNTERLRIAYNAPREGTAEFKQAVEKLTAAAEALEKAAEKQANATPDLPRPNPTLAKPDQDH